MFVRGLARVGEYQSRGWKMEDWYKYPGVATPPSIIPGVPNTTTAVVAGGSLVALAAAYAAAKYFKIFA